MDAEFYARLSGSAGVAALCGDAIYSMIAPEDARGRFVVWQRITGIPEAPAMDNESAIMNARVQVDSYGLTYGDARELADAVRATLLDWRGDLIALARLENDRAIRETDPALKMFRVSQDYLVTFTQD